MLLGLNALLPKSIRVHSLERAPANFHPTVDCIKKEYHYRIDCGKFASPFGRNIAWHIPQQLDLDAMRKATRLLIGTKDFATFSNIGSHEDTIRTIDRIEIDEDDFLNFKVVGKSFLYKMVRNLVGTLAFVGQRKINLEDVENILNSKDRRDAGMCAPAKGLVLKQVYY